MPTTQRLAAALFLSLLPSLAPAQSLPAPASPLKTIEKPLGLLDQGDKSGWGPTSNAQVELTTDHAQPGKSALKVTLSPGQYPGVAYDTKPIDLSNCQSIRFNIFNAGGDLKLSYRVDEAATKDFATRFQSDLPLRLARGDNSLEISIAALRHGNLFSRGIDVSQFRSLRFFVGGLKEETTLYISNIRLISKEGPPSTFTLADFSPTSPVKLEAKEGTRLTTEEPAAPGAPRKLKLEISAGNYPGVTFTALASDWLGYDLLAFKLSPIKDAPMPDNVSIKIVDDNDRRMTFSTSLVENKGEVSLPVELAGQLSLGHIKEVTLFFGNAMGKTVCLEDFRLQRLDHVDYANVHTDTAKDLGVKLDFAPLTALGKNSVFMNVLMVPLPNGKTRIIRCNSETKGNVLYEVPADALKDCPPGSSIDVWGYLTEHGVWNFRKTSVKFEGTLPLTVTFDDAKKFNH